MTHHPDHDPLGDLAAAGVAVWLDDLSRELLADGGLRSLVAARSTTVWATEVTGRRRWKWRLSSRRGYTRTPVIDLIFRGVVTSIARGG